MDAMTTFMANIAKANGLLESITIHMEDHMNRNPEKITYADAGDAGRMVAMLEEIMETFNIQDV